jgi:putative peptidoglycan lipid II flippase
MSNTSQHQILKSSSKMAVATFLSRILGLVREQVLAHFFGATIIADAFWIAYKIPNMLRDLFAEGAFSSAFIPIFTEKSKQSKEEAGKLLLSTAILLSFLTGFCVVAMIAVAPQLINLIAPKIADDQETFKVTVLLMRIMSPFLWLISIAALFMGALNTYKVFFIPALAPALFNLAMIFCLIFLRSPLEKFGFSPALSLGIGVIIGGFLQALIQLPLLKKNGLLILTRVKILTSSTKSILKRLGIGTIGIAGTQLNVLLTTFLANSSGTGAVSWLTYSFRLFQFPVGILGVSVAGSNLVHFSDAWKSNEKEKAIEYLRTSLNLSLFMMLPSMLFLVLLAQQCTELIFQRGSFTATDTMQTALALQCYALGLPFYSVNKIFAPVYYAIDRPRLPVIFSLITLVINMILCWKFTAQVGFHFLAIGTTLTMLLNCILLWLGLNLLLGALAARFFSLFLVKLLVACGVAAIATQLISRQIEALNLSLLLEIGLIGLCIVGFYFLFLILMGEGKQTLFIFNSISKKLTKKR